MPFSDPDERRRYHREWKAARRTEYFVDKVCAHCGSTDRLELDHVDPERKISHKIWSWSAVRREAELAKCQVLCYDCHKIKTRQWYIDHREHGLHMFIKYGCRCDDCWAARRAARARETRVIKRRARGSNPAGSLTPLA